MSEEDKKAIERCKELIKTEHSCWIGISNQLAIEKLLNIMQLQQEQIDLDNETEIALNNKIIDLEIVIEKLSNNNKRLLKKLRNRVKEVKKLTKYSLYKKEFSRLNENIELKKVRISDLQNENEYLKLLLEKKNKIIDEMARSWKQDDIRSVEEIKQYFEKKVEESNVK